MGSGDSFVKAASLRMRASLLAVLLACAAAASLLAAGPAAADPPYPICIMSPLVGGTSGGTEVNIASGNFGTVTSVKFGGVESLGFTVFNDYSLAAVAPPHAPGSVDITVTNTDGTSAICGPADEPNYVPFRYVEPTGGSFSWATSMAIGRTDHTATRLLDGRVLFIGGHNSDGNVHPPEIYDPATHSSMLTGEMNQNRVGHTATLLADGKVLVAGGQALTGQDPDTGADVYAPATSAEVYDPVTNMWTLTANELTVARSDSETATRLDNGKVILVGGRNPANSFLPEASTELYDPATNMWSSCPPPAVPSANCPGNVVKGRRSH